ncbi:Ig-like domain-containing protein [Actinomycetes bacterium NPDC127524]
MQRLVGFVLVLLLFALPLKGYAQGGEEVSPRPEKNLNANVLFGKEPKHALVKEADYHAPSVDSYAVISNESTDGYSKEPTGAFSLKSMMQSMDKSMKPSKIQLDYNKPFDVESNRGKKLNKSTKSIEKSYNIGETKYFWVSNLATDQDYQISARLAYSGTKANVWVNDNQISDANAERLGREFDTKIYSSVTNNFGYPSDIDNNGKVNILTYDIQDGFTGSGGYVAGYFWAGDLFNLTNSNRSEIFYIDTYPAMGMGSSTKDVTAAYDTLAHEFQHMVNFNQNVSIERSSSNMDTWLNEGLSMAAEQIYKGAGLQDRIDYYNSTSSIQNGHSLLYWDDDGDTLANYSLSYLFVQYIKIQANQGDRIFKEILQDPDNNYKAIEDVAKKYISPDMTFGKLMSDFRIALLLKQPTGLYGFKGDSFFDSIQKKIFTGSSINLRGGGAVVITYDPAVGLPEPDEKGQDVTYTLLGPKIGNVDQTTPDKPFVNGINDKDTQITGTAEANATVYATVNQSKVGRTISDSSGAFTIAIPKQSSGTVVNVYVQDSSGNVSEAATVTVTVNPVVNVVTDKGTSVTGQAEAGSKVEVKVRGVVIGRGTTGPDGKFAVVIPIQKAGTSLVIKVTDKAGNVSAETIIIVKDVTAPIISKINEVTDHSKEVRGLTEKGATVIVFIRNSRYKNVADANGYFWVGIPQQMAGVKIYITASDGINESQKKMLTVLDKTAPIIQTINEFTNKSNNVTGKTEANSIVTVIIGSKKYTAAADKNGNYTVKISIQKAGTKLAISVKDAAGNVGKTKIVTVIDKIAPTAPKISTIVTSSSTKIKGTAEAYSIIIIKIGNKVIGTAKADVKGKFTEKISKQKKNSILSITAIDKAKNISKSFKVKVK